MSLQPVSLFRNGAFALTTAAVLAAISFHQAQAQTTLAANPPSASSQPRGVSTSECGVFGSFLLEEARDYKRDLSREFLMSAGRFLKAGCKPTDAHGEIQVITMNRQDAVSLETALMRMGKVDIIRLSGVKGCHRPESGVCPLKTGSNPPKVGGG